MNEVCVSITDIPSGTSFYTPVRGAADPRFINDALVNQIFSVTYALFCEGISALVHQAVGRPWESR